LRISDCGFRICSRRDIHRLLQSEIRNPKSAIVGHVRMLNYVPTLSASFVTPAFFVAGLLLVSIPIVIHILNRRRFKTVTWAAMEYLLRAMRKNRRRLKFEQMILLATRCLVLALLGAALARPMMCENAATALGGRNGLNVLVIDNSYSMAYAAPRGDAPTHLAQAKKIAKGLIDRLNAGGESVAVVVTARPIRSPDSAAPEAGDDAIVVRPGYDLEAAKAAVDRIEQSYSGTDLPNALQLALRLGNEDTRQSERRLYLISDATRAAYEGPQSQALQQIGQDLSKVFRVTHYNLTDGRQQSNLAVADIRPDTNLVTTKFGAGFAAKVGGYGTVADAPLHWYLNDNPLPDTPPKRYDPITDAAAPAPGKPDANSAVQSGAKFVTGGPQVLTVSVAGGDPLKEDDTRRRVVDVAAELKVLIVEGQRGISALEGSGAFLQVALAPQRDAAPGVKGTNSYVAAELISDLELGNKPLDEYSTIVLTGVGEILPAQADGLARFVGQGGTLMTFMGEAVNSENYNAVLLPRKLLPGPLVKRMSTAQNEEGFLFAFPPQGVPHPFLKLFIGEENTGIENARVFTYWEADVASNAGVERVLDYLPRGAKPASATQPARGAPAAGADAPDPAITVHTLGRGRVVFVSTTANSEWTTLPAKPNYVTLVHELLQGSVRTGDYWMNLTVGQPVEVPPAIRLAGPPTLLDSSKRPVVIEAVTDPDGRQVYRSRPLAKPGVYTLATGNRVFPVAVNIPPAEADVRTIGNEGVKKALGNIEMTFRGDQLPTESVSSESGNDLSWVVMVAVFVLLLLECWMAMRFGHYRRTDVRKAGGGMPSPAGVPQAA
jgi:hypothetical protein